MAERNRMIANPNSIYTKKVISLTQRLFDNIASDEYRLNYMFKITESGAKAIVSVLLIEN
ncbi:MAG: hypothetical protein OEZ29_08110 [Candidatus Bathyarchaeota archaeon]|nr:hypothetical protein [Candidatus Bathyarchaeota archaeon]MDH5780545.1 hypothetical protein [Candidatus Bathyarchaeota archaeon]